MDNSQKGSASTIVIVIVLAIIIAGGYYLYSRNGTQGLSVADLTGAPSGNASVFTDSTYKYSLDIPVSFHVSQNSGNQVVFTNGNLMFTLRVDIPFGPVEWDPVPGYNTDVIVGGQRIGGIELLKLNAEAAVASNIKTPTYMFVGQLTPGDGHSYVFTSSWLNDQQIGGSSSAFSQLVKSFQKI